MMKVILPFVIGYSFSVFLGHVFTQGIVDAAYRRLPNAVTIRGEVLFVRVLGLLERALYTASWQFGKPEFVGVWLVLKVAGQWKAWHEPTEEGGSTIHPRELFAIFLIGNGLSLLYATTGAKLIEWIAKCDWLPAISVPMVIILSSGMVWYWTARRSPSVV